LARVRKALIWTLGRLGQRVPVYGPLNTVVPANRAEQWLEALLHRPDGGPSAQLAVMQLARRTDDRYRDLPGKLRDQVAQWLRNEQAAAHLVELVEHGGRLETEEQGLIFGESLPQGLRLP
jgi:hypothetical protein